MARPLYLLFFDRRLLVRFDWVLFFLVLSIAAVGICNLYSAGGPESVFFKKQIRWFLLGAVFLLIGAFLNYSHIEQYCYFFYFFSLFLLILVLFHGPVLSGSRRWLSFGVFTFQPSELMKLALVMVLAKCFHKKNPVGGHTLRSLFIPFLFVFIPFSLIYLEPDLGTALLLFLVFFSLVFFVKINPRSFLIFLFSFFSLFPLSWNFLKPYQKERVLGFLAPDSDPLGRGYQVIQSKIAIGSGRFWGKGFLQGTQSRLDFVPEKDTDFVFSVFCEEWGFLGAGFLLFLYLLLFVRLFSIVSRAKNSFGVILGTGLAVLFFLQFTINLGMVLGLLPTVGIPLPLFSYGGSSLVVNMFLVGIVISIHIQRYIF